VVLPQEEVKSMRALLIISVVMIASFGCRSPEDTTETFPSYVTDFDASVPDGGEPAPIAECAENGEYHFNNNFSPYFGGESALDAEVVHFSSFYCFHCADFAVYTHARWQNRADYSERVRIYFHHATFTFRHRAAVAAGNQGMDNFWKLHDFIYSEMINTGGPTDDEVTTFVEKTLKLDMNRFTADLNADETYAFLKWDANQGYAAGMVGTPTVFVCGDTVKYWTDLEDYVDENL
jgi:2-hydroxychromene-2-carboxylate isomerase